MRRSSGRRALRSLLAALFVGSLFAAGCTASGSSAVPSSVPSTGGASVATSSAPVSGSPSAAITPPVLPAAARQATPAGAEAFFLYFWQVYNYTFATRDPSLLTSISDPGCAFCKSSVDTVNREVRSNIRFVGGSVSVVDCAARPDDPEIGLLITGVVDQEPSSTVDAQGTVLSSDPPDRAKAVEAAAAFEHGGWRMLAMDNHPKP